jgi:hypothetical protein
VSDDNNRRNLPPVLRAVGESSDVPIQIFHAIANLWLAVQSLTEAGEHVEANHVHLPMERICLKYKLPLAEAELHADLRKMN